MRSPKLASILGYIYSLRRFRSFFVGTDGNFCRLYEGFLKHVRFLVVTKQSGFPELSPYRKQSKMQSILEK